MTEKTKRILKNIVQLIENKDLPARRVIADYVVMLFPYDLQKEAENYIGELYKKSDEKKGKKT